MMTKIVAKKTTKKTIQKSTANLKTSYLAILQQVTLFEISQTNFIGVHLIF